MEWLRHTCRMPLADQTALRHGTRWTCPRCGQTWEARGFLGAADDLRLVRVRGGDPR